MSVLLLCCGQEIAAGRAGWQQVSRGHVLSCSLLLCSLAIMLSCNGMQLRQPGQAPMKLPQGMAAADACAMHSIPVMAWSGRALS